MKSLINSLYNNNIISLIMKLVKVIELYLSSFNRFLNYYCVVSIIQGFVRTSITSYDVAGR